MGIYKRLDEIIKEKTVNDTEYEKIKMEIVDYFSGRNTDLHTKTWQIIIEWENLIKEMNKCSNTRSFYG